MELCGYVTEYFRGVGNLYRMCLDFSFLWYIVLGLLFLDTVNIGPKLIYMYLLFHTTTDYEQLHLLETVK